MEYIDLIPKDETKEIIKSIIDYGLLVTFLFICVGISWAFIWYLVRRNSKMADDLATVAKEFAGIIKKE